MKERKEIYYAEYFGLPKRHNFTERKEYVILEELSIKDGYGRSRHDYYRVLDDNNLPQLIPHFYFGCYGLEDWEPEQDPSWKDDILLNADIRKLHAFLKERNGLGRSGIEVNRLIKSTQLQIDKLKKTIETKEKYLETLKELE
jgi:hypothetical protein